ncbi:MAG: hypothetical protein ACP5NL_04840 [Thermoplasmata archaeon]
MEPFYFKSYDRVIGIACDLESLLYNIRCISSFDREAINWHVTEGHIAMWLDYIGHAELADKLRNAKNSDAAIEIIRKYVEDKTSSAADTKIAREKSMAGKEPYQRKQAVRKR